jgi:predicted Zn-dependent peptidase
MYRKTLLQNGVRIVSERMDYLPSVSLGIWVNVGSRDEAELENGISHFIEHMIFKGTRRRTGLQIAKELDAMGGFSNAFTGKESTCFHARVLGKHFDPLAEILSDIFLNSTFPPDEMEKEKDVVRQEISMVEDIPEENVQSLFNRHFWGGHPMGMPILGSEGTVSAIRREDIRDYIRRFYVPDRILIAAAGAVDHERLVGFFSPLLDHVEPGPVALTRSAPEVRPGWSCRTKDLEQVHVCLGAAAPSLCDERRFACAILNTILGGNMSSRLFQEIREKQGLAYTVYSFHTSYLDSGMLGAYLATDPDQVKAALETLSQELRKIRSGELSDADLAAAREHLIGGIYLSSESADNRMMRNAKNELVYGRYVPYEEVTERLEAVRLEDVLEAAKEIFQEGRVAMTVLGPLGEDEIGKHPLKFD